MGFIGLIALVVVVAFSVACLVASHVVGTADVLCDTDESVPTLLAISRVMAQESSKIYQSRGFCHAYKAQGSRQVEITTLRADTGQYMDWSDCDRVVASHNARLTAAAVPMRHRPVNQRQPRTVRLTAVQLATA